MPLRPHPDNAQASGFIPAPGPPIYPSKRAPRPSPPFMGMSKRPGHAEIQRARWQLWAVTFAILGSLAAVLVFVASGTNAVERHDPLPQGTLRIALIGLVVAFVLYAIDRERNLRRLADRLTSEQIESAELSTQLRYVPQLQRERETNDALFEGAADGIVVVDNDLRLLRFNDAMQTLCGQSRGR